MASAFFCSAFPLPPTQLDARALRPRITAKAAPLQKDPPTTPTAEHRDRLGVPNTPEVRHDALKAMRVAIGDLRNPYGRIQVPWGSIKRLRRGEKEWPLSGDGLGKLSLDALRATAADTFDPQDQLIPRGGQWEPPWCCRPTLPRSEPW